MLFGKELFELAASHFQEHFLTSRKEVHFREKAAKLPGKKCTFRKLSGKKYAPRNGHYFKETRRLKESLLIDVF